MQVDITTLADLSIFHSDEEQSLFHHLNHTQTIGGKDHLRQLLHHPLESLEAVLDTQHTIRCLMEIADAWPAFLTNGTVMMIERYYESPINNFSERPNQADAFIYRILNGQDFSLIKYSVEHVIDFTRGLQIIVNLLDGKRLSQRLSRWISRMSMLLGKPTIQNLQTEDKKKLSAVNVLTYGGFIRKKYENSAFELIEIYSKLDAYLALAIACKKNGYQFPDISEAASPFIAAKGLFHPLLQTPVAYDMKLDQEKNFLFLTGANMAGKSTFIKAVGVSAYLAHIGMAVPAQEMQLSFLDGLLSNIQVVDNIIKGESFFFNEVQRIKNTVEKISDGRNWLILIDELFKGTNQQDAVKCSVTVIQGLRKLKNAIFVLSTHLYEIADELRIYDNIQFHYFETSVQDDQLVFSYQLKEGVSNDRLGYLILKKEGVVNLLEKL